MGDEGKGRSKMTSQHCLVLIILFHRKTEVQSNYCSSREQFDVEDIVPPNRNQLLVAFTACQQRVTSKLEYACHYQAFDTALVVAGHHEPELMGQDDLHAPIRPIHVSLEEDQIYG